MDRKEFLKRAGGLGVYGCVASLLGLPGRAGARGVEPGAPAAASGGRAVREGDGATRPTRMLALVGSPRKGRNTDTLTEALLRGAREGGAEVEKVYLVDRRIAPCVRCEACHQSLWAPCRVEDDFPPIAERMVAADVIVLATPIWWSTVHSLTKLLLDRCYSLVSADWSRCRLEGRRFVLIACQGQENLDLYVNPFVKEFKVYENDLKIRVVGSLVASASRAGGVAGDTALLDRAARLGRSLALTAVKG